MTATIVLDGGRTSAPGFGRLVGTELRRLAARRFARVLLGACLLGYLIAVAWLFQDYAKPTAADYAQATVQRDAQIKDIAASVDQCLKAPGGSAANCGKVAASRVPRAGTRTPRNLPNATATAAIVPVWMTRNEVQPYRKPHSGL